MSATADAPLMLFSASIALCVGALLVVNRVRVAPRNADSIRMLRDVYGPRLTERVARSSTPKQLGLVGLCFVLFGLGSLVILVFRIAVPFSDVTVFLVAVAGAVQLVAAGVLLLRYIADRGKAGQTRQAISAQRRTATNALIAGVCGALTIAALVLLQTLVSS